MSLAQFQARLRNDNGSAVSVLIIFLAAYMFVELMIFGGRLAGAKADVAAAAREGARAGSYALTPGDAQGKAITKASSFMFNRGHQCRIPTFSSDSSNFQPGGTYSFTARCTVDLSDLSVLPFSVPIMNIEYTATEIIEQYRVVD